ncbi:hypothetical protein [Rhizosaccharibacter radicis]|uniref:Lipoprotein n=1 Tax=Rhizosaccharibacter radicis TaxID=2782605 RepID=A0ABT1W0T6_9PROT|nr:hypothetical protein [Acetobacteraceae bacterium KSS12]
MPPIPASRPGVQAARPSGRRVAAWRGRPLALRLLPLGLLAALPAGCGPSDENAFAPTCAPVGILADAADYSDYGGHDADLTTLVSQGSITGVAGKCANNNPGTQLHTVVHVDMAVTRGPAAPGRDITIPYFIAVTRDGRILNKQSLTAVAHFPPNGTRVALSTEPTVLDLPVSRTRDGTSYRLEVGFQLTPAQLSYNQSHLRQ